MKAILVAAVAVAALASNAALASEQLAKEKNCLACHAIDNKVVGPGYKEVAAKYKGDKSAEAKLATKIQKRWWWCVGSSTNARQPSGERSRGEEAGSMGVVVEIIATLIFQEP